VVCPWPWWPSASVRIFEFTKQNRIKCNLPLFFIYIFFTIQNLSSCHYDWYKQLLVVLHTQHNETLCDIHQRDAGPCQWLAARHWCAQTSVSLSPRRVRCSTLQEHSSVYVASSPPRHSSSVTSTCVKFTRMHQKPVLLSRPFWTRSQAVARIPDLLPHSTFGGHVTSSVRDHLIAHMSFPIGGPLEPSLSL